MPVIFDHVRNRRFFENKVKRTVFINSDEGGDKRTFHVFGFSLNSLQKSMILIPWGPRAVPTGGAGLAAPAWMANLTTIFIF